MKNLNKLILIVLISIVGISIANAQCASSFTYVYNGNGSITFTNTSTGTMSYAHWDLGDGGYLWDTSTTVQYSYYMNGTYSVCLTEGDSATGCTSTFCDSITIFGIYNCNANFTFTNNGSNNISFNNLSLGNYTSVLWNFDDGFTSNSNNPNHTYASPGVYNVCLTVNDSNSGCSDTQCYTVTLTGPANCNASFTYVNNGNGTVTFTNTSTGNYMSWYWDFGDGNQSWMTNAPTHTYYYNGTYNVCLFVVDSTSGCYDTFCNSVVITNYPPCLSNFYYYPDSLNVFDVIVVNNAYGFYLTYLWDFGDGNTSTQQFPQHTYATTGNYYLCLTVDNGSGCVDTYCDSINASGINKTGFTINVVDPNATNIIEVDNKAISTISAYPNPVKNNLSITLNLTEQAKVEVFVTDLLGKQISVITNETMPTGDNTLQWTPANISNGIYLLNIKTNNSLQVKKLVLNR
ncbi:MAG: hypothetical protein A3K10_16110 [Bacteroidetes bacterium RIFCSPLOWO2_12_FULL_31_6]|nr:MAG: hypothetical protein A3K10_16110 [Bacteroidetes bacterium RIFCSPLOWO2_12_FULL_31_6]